MDLNGNFIKRWNGLREIEIETGFLREAISRHCRGHKLYKHAYGYLWKFELNEIQKTNISQAESGDNQIQQAI